MIKYIFLLFIVILIIRTSTNQYEHFCPNKLTYENYQYFLWKDESILTKFLTYYEYLQFYNFMQSNYKMKNIYCKPLNPILQKNNNQDTISKNWKTNKEFRYNLRI